MSNIEVVTAATAAILEEKIRSRRARVGIVGLGYVGLPLAVEFAKAGFTVTGIDISEEKVRRVNAGDSYVGDIPSSTLVPLVASGKLRATTDFSAVLELDTINICVPTPLRKTKDPDMSFIVASCEEIARHFHAGTLVILESTTYPGTTEELVLPILRSEEHTSELQSLRHLVCRLLLENDPATPEIYTLSLHDALPICHFHAGTLVILESTTYPGTTEELVLPIL